MAETLPLLIAPAVLVLFVGALVLSALIEPLRAWRSGATAIEALGRTSGGARVGLSLLGYAVLQALGVVAALYVGDDSRLLAILAVVTPIAVMFGAFAVSAPRRHRALAPATREREDAVTRAHGRIALVVVPVMIATLAAPEIGDEAWSLLVIPVVGLGVGAARAWRRGDRQTAGAYAVLFLFMPLLVPVVMMMTWWEVEAPFEVAFFVELVIIAPLLLLGAGAVALARWVRAR